MWGCSAIHRQADLPADSQHLQVFDVGGAARHLRPAHRGCSLLDASEFAREFARFGFQLLAVRDLRMHGCWGLAAQDGLQHVHVLLHEHASISLVLNPGHAASTVVSSYSMMC